MKAPSSKSWRQKVPLAGIGVLAIAAVFLLVTPIFTSAAGPYVDVSATATYGVPSGSMTISGAVVPNPGSGQEVNIVVNAPDGASVVDTDVGLANATGTYSFTTPTGGNPNWVNGTYTVEVTWGTLTNAYTNTTTVAYGKFVTSTSTSSSSHSTSSSPSGTGTTTTIVSQITTTIVSAVTTTIVSGSGVGTTIISGTTITTIVSSGAPTTIMTTITSSSSAGLAEALGAVGIVIAVIAGALAAMALRKK